MSDLFKAQYNPDVLSCIANLSNDEVFTPPEIANQMLDLLPKEIWSDPKATFLDPACKSGVFLRECAKRLIEGQLPGYQLRVDKINEKKADGEELDEADESYLLQLETVLENIFKRQLYGMAITELTSLLARRSVYCSKFPNSDWSVVKFDNAEGNIDYKHMEHDWCAGRCSVCGASQKEYLRDESLEQYAYEFIHLDNPEEVLDMKFDVIISNPPYQLSDGGHGASAIPIYQKFVQQAKKLNPRYLSMIIPSRWFAGGRGLDSFRKEMLNDSRISKLYDFFNSEECFPGIDLSGGVCYFLWDRDYDGPCSVTASLNGNKTTVIRPLLEANASTFIRFNDAISILDKIKLHNDGGFQDIVSANDPFGYDVRVENSYKRVKPDIKNDSFPGALTIHYWGKGKSQGYISRDTVRKGNEYIDKIKLFISRSYGERGDLPYLVIGKPFIGLPGEVCTETYLLIGTYESETEAANVASYMTTKFFRFLVMLKKNTQSATRAVYEFVPMQDFTRSWSDEDLYDKYALNPEEINLIESMIRPLGDDLNE